MPDPNMLHTKACLAEACTCPTPDPVDLLLSIRARQLELVRDTERLQRLIEA